MNKWVGFSRLLQSPLLKVPTRQDFEREDEISIPIHRADNLTVNGIRHGFFTRDGGVSTGLYESLNVGLGSDDARECIEANRKIVTSAMGFDENSLRTLYQVHSNRVIIVQPDDPTTPAPDADALVTTSKRVLLGILTADCTPVLMADPAAGVIAATHAGWKGALGGVIESAVAAMESLGARRNQIRAAVGPTIAQASYEVGGDLRDAFLGADSSYDAFFAPGNAGRYQFDLEGFVVGRLVAAQTGSIELLGIDTYPSENRLFSYRRTTHRNEPDYGRQISVIGLSTA